MKTVNSKILSLMFSVMAIFALSGCGSSGTSSNDELVGGTPVVPPVVTPPVAGTPVVAPSYEITAHHDSTVVVHSHVTPSPTGDEHAHEWTQVSGPTVALTTPTAQTTTFVAPANTTQPVVLQHVVKNVKTDKQTTTQHKVVPIPAAVPLTLVLNQHKSVGSGQKTSFHVSVSGGDGQYTYAIVQKSGPKVDMDETFPSSPLFLAPAVSMPVDLVFDVTVTDTHGNIGTQTVTITVLILHNSTAYGTVVGVHGRVWLDRNLGASRVCTAFDDDACYGDYYQWGRNFDGHNLKGSATTQTLATEINPGHGSFIYGNGYSDWMVVKATSAYNRRNIWGNPSVCPVGFGVPSKTELEDEMDAWGTDGNSASAFASSLKWSVNGYRKGNGTSADATTISDKNVVGYYWSRTNNTGINITSAALVIGPNSGDTQMWDSVRVQGMGIRCIKNP